MAQYDPDAPGQWYAVVSWHNSGEGGVSTKVYFGGPFGSPPASETLPFVGTAGPGIASLQINLGSDPEQGTYYAQVRHTKVGSPDSDFVPVPPTDTVGPA
jgi:hypothetical protein